MNREKVESSNIESIGHDDGSQTLEVEFKNGTIYQYFDVDRTKYNELMAATSKGEYLAKYIKGHYRYSKI